VFLEALKDMSDELTILKLFFITSIGAWCEEFEREERYVLGLTALSGDIQALGHHDPRLVRSLEWLLFELFEVSMRIMYIIIHLTIEQSCNRIGTLMGYYGITFSPVTFSGDFHMNYLLSM